MFRKIMAMAVLMSFCAMAQDVFMGDYKGTLKDAEGKESALCAQVWATGKGGYQAVFTETIYEAPKPKVLLKLDGAVVGYLPLINQYQIRFNTSSLTDLNQKKFCWVFFEFLILILLSSFLI